MDKTEIIGATLAVVALIVIGSLLVSGYSECSEIGGDYVRGLFWMKCVK